MGTDLILKYKGEEIVDLGRLHNYVDFSTHELELDEDKLFSEVDNMVSRYEKAFVAAAAYSPTSHEDMQEVIEGISEDIELLRESLIEYGMRIMLARVLDSELEYEKDY